MIHKTLPTIYKSRYPFKIGTTSFIYPAGYHTNARLLAPFVDEIELLFFECEPQGGLPDEGEIETLRLLAADNRLTYNVHLPMDIFPGSPDSRIRRQALEGIKRIVSLTRPLSPSTYTLHLPWEGPAVSGLRPAWSKRLCRFVNDLCQWGLAPERVSVETLDFPFHWLDDLLADFPVKVCIDLGHLLVHGVDPYRTFQIYGPRTVVIHLHGTDGKHDHLALDHLSDALQRVVISILSRFKGVVSLEVFSYPDLVSSLETLDFAWMQRLRF